MLNFGGVPSCWFLPWPQGATCRYAHSASELRRAPDLQKTFRTTQWGERQCGQLRWNFRWNLWTSPIFSKKNGMTKTIWKLNLDKEEGTHIILWMRCWWDAIHLDALIEHCHDCISLSPWGSCAKHMLKGTVLQAEKQRLAICSSYCWWFRNPAVTTWECAKTIVNSGINYQPQLVSFRISGCHQQ